MAVGTVLGPHGLGLQRSGLGVGLVSSGFRRHEEKGSPVYPAGQLQIGL